MSLISRLSSFVGATAIGVAFLSTGIAQAQTIYSGRDLMVNVHGNRPNSDAAAASFDAAAVSGQVLFQNFEGFTAKSYDNNLQIGNAFKSVIVTTTNIDNGKVTISDTNDLFRGFNTTNTNGANKHLQVTTNSTPSTLVFTLNPGVYGFGGYFTGIGVLGSDVDVLFNDGTQKSYDLNNYVGVVAQAGTGFFGFIDAGKSISSLTFRINRTTGGFDNEFGMDDLRFVSAVPEPGEYAAFGLLFASVGAGIVRQRLARRS